MFKKKAAKCIDKICITKLRKENLKTTFYDAHAFGSLCLFGLNFLT